MLAARRAGITDIILSRENMKDVVEIKEIYRDGLSLHYVDNILQVLEYALLNEKVQKPLKIEPEKTVKQPVNE
jgi:ATP-dependent Lon protease